MTMDDQIAPEAAPTFDALPLSDEVRRALDEIGYTHPTPVQLATYEPAVAGRDIIVQARTGTGKTAAFAIPLADKILKNEPRVQALVLAPTRELALQSTKELSRIGRYRNLRATAVYGGAPMGRQITELEAGAQIVSGTPGRVLDHLRRGTLDASALKVLVLDEMDEMLSMGFARELNAILELIPDRMRRQTMCSRPPSTATCAGMPSATCASRRWCRCRATRWAPSRSATSSTWSAAAIASAT